MNDPRDEFQDERLSAWYRETRGVEPPTWLDQRILTAARAAAPKRRSGRSWALPTALAATLALTLGIVRLARETGQFTTPLETKIVRSPATPATEADSAAGALTPAAPPIPARRPDSAKPWAADHAPTPPASPAPAQSIAPPAGPARLESQAVPAPPDPANRARMTAPEARSQESSQTRPMRQHQEPAPVLDQAARRPPTEWLAEIAELRRRGRTAEAEASLAEFRRRYPDHPLDAARESPR